MFQFIDSGINESRHSAESTFSGSADADNGQKAALTITHNQRSRSRNIIEPEHILERRPGGLDVDRASIVCPMSGHVTEPMPPLSGYASIWRYEYGDDYGDAVLFGWFFAGDVRLVEAVACCNERISKGRRNR